MTIEQFHEKIGLLSITIKMDNIGLFVKETRPFFSRSQRISFNELSSNYSVVKHGIPGMFTLGVYFFVITMVLNLLQKRFSGFEFPIIEVGTVVVLFCFVVEHLKLFRVAQFQFKTGNKAVQIRLKHDQFIEELASRIGKSRSGGAEGGDGSEESNP